MIEVKAYYHFVEEFQNVDYLGLNCKEEESFKILTFTDADELAGFMKKNDFEIIPLTPEHIILKRGNSVYGQVERVS